MKYTIEKLYRLVKQSNGINTDSRKLEKGEIFLALKGENFNGNDYAEEAINETGSYAIVDDPAISMQDRFILVNNSLQTLHELASYHRKQLSIPVLAITGSNGKTTTKELITKVLSKQFRVSSTQGNLNNHIGVPLTLLKIDNDAEIAIIEMGANHPGEIKLLCQITDPDFGIITNIGKAHLEGFGSYEGIILAKRELYDFIRNKNGRLFVHADDDLLMKLSDGIERQTYGQNGTPDINGKLFADFPGIDGEISFNHNKLLIRSPLYGDYNFLNILAAASVGSFFRISPENIHKAIEEYAPDNMRSQILLTDDNRIYLDAYNANPASMLSAINYFSRIPVKNKWVLLGDMLELGVESDKEHKTIVNCIVEMSSVNAIYIGNRFLKAAKPHGLQSFGNINEAIVFLQQNPISDSFILVKGSRGMKLERLLEYL